MGVRGVGHRCGGGGVVGVVVRIGVGRRDMANSGLMDITRPDVAQRCTYKAVAWGFFVSSAFFTQSWPVYIHEIRPKET